MTKEQFLNKWAYVYNVNDTTNPYFVSDLEAVIAHEVAKAQPEKTNKIEITPYALIELNRAFCVLKDDESIKLHNFFGNDAINEIKQVYEAYFRGKERQIKPEEANPQPELKFKIGDRLINFNKGGSYGNVCKLLANCPFELYDINTKTYFITNSLSGYELYTEPTEQPSSQVKLDNSFDKERFEAMFRAVIETHEATMNALKQLDSYYATKNN